MLGCLYPRRLTIVGTTAVMLALLLLSTFSFASGDQTLFGPKRYDRQKGKPTVYTDHFAGCIAGEQATLKVANGDGKKTRITSARIYIDGIEVASERDFKRKHPSFEKTVTIHKSNQLKAILKGGRHSYHKGLNAYLERNGDLADLLSKLQELRKRITQSGDKLSSGEIDHLLREFQDIGKSFDDRDVTLIRLSKSLGDNFEEDEDGDDNDHDDPFDSDWLREQRAAFEENRKEIGKTYDDCKYLRDAHDRTKPKYRDYEYDKKKDALHGLCDFLEELDGAIKRAADRLAEIEDKIEEWKKESAFIIVEIIGKICDEAAPVLSNPLPADGSVVDSAAPAISVQYADGAAGAGIDTASVRMILDGRDVTSLSVVTDSGVSHTPAENLADGPHAVTVNVFDQAHNQASLTWSFTIRTVVTVVKITSHQNNQYLNTPVVTVSGSITNPTAVVTVNGDAAEVSGNSFSLFGVALTEGPNTITAVATDALGNVSRDSMTINLDTIAPVVRVNVPMPDGYVHTPAVTVAGYVNEPVAALAVNGVAAVVTETGFRLEGVTLLEGSNVMTVEAIDRAGNIGTVTLSVTLDTLPPVIDITAPRVDAYLNTPIIAVTGTLNETVASVTVNGAAAAITGNEFRLVSLTLTEGPNTILVEAKDQAGNIGTVAFTVHLDREQPVIEMASSGPVAYVNIPIFTVAGTVSEPVASVMVNGVNADVTGTDFSLSGVTLAEGANTITVETTDRAGNIGTVSVTIHLDTAPPAVRITAPAPGAFVNAPVIAVAGTLSEPECTVTVNGALAQVTGTNFNLKGLALAEGANTITATVTDRAGNTATATVGVALDTALPVITIAASAQAAAGANVSIAVSATDNVGLALCELFINQVPIWSFAAAAQPGLASAIAYSLSPDMAPGTALNLTARATDIAGNLVEENARIIVSSGPSGPGYLQGEVYDDTRGLRLEGATAAIEDASGQPLTGLTTQADGRYFYQTAAGDYLIRLAKAGFTTVDRLVNVRPEKNSAAIDARLTPVSTVPTLIGANGGRITAGSGLELVVPVAALDQQVDMRITPISNQGLAGLLPIGWSPIAAAEIRTPGATAIFLQPASLKIPLAGAVALAPSSTVPLVRYDTSGHRWIVQGVATAIGDGALLTAPIPFLGQYAVVLPDHGLVPPVLVDGQPLPPFSVTSATDGIAAVGKVVPPAAPPAVGLRAVGEVVAGNVSSPLYSGMLINGRVTERFDLLTGESVAPMDYIQDMILYQYPCATNLAPASTGSTLNTDLGVFNTGKVGTSFPVTPSRECTILDLLAGKVSIEISLPPAEVKGTMAGVDGARIADADGNILFIPPGALAQTVPVEMKTIEPALVAGLVGSDFSLLRAVEINLANQALAQTAEISIPVPQGLDPALSVIVAKLIDVRGAGRLKLVALARISGSLITSVMLPTGGGSALSPGISASGAYFFLQARASLGFVIGQVTDVGGNPYPAALVTSNTCSLVDLTGADGNYLIAATVSVFIVRTKDIYKYDEGEAAGELPAAGQTAIVNLTIRQIPPRVDAVTFTDSGRGIEPNTSITVTFNKALDKTTVTGENITVKDGSGNRLSGTFSNNPEGSVVTFYPADLLTSQATYTLTVSQNIRDLQGYLMGRDDVRSFTIRNTTPPPMPPAGSIVGSFPDAEGYVTITATQGSAAAENIVLIINDTTGETLSITPASNGSFTGRIFGMLGDEIRILLMDNAGNQTPISTIAMKNADGSYLVTGKGGTVEGEGGTRLVIPDGALPGPTVVKIVPVAEAALPQPVPPEARFLAAVKIDAGGAKFLKPVKLSVPAPANAAEIPAGSMPIVSQPTEITHADGTKEQVYLVADSAKIIDGRLTTASPPFGGVLFGGNWVFEYPYMDVAIISGTTYRDMNGTSGYQPGSDLPVKRAVIRTPGAWNHVSYSDMNGFYAAFAEVAASVPGYPCRSWGLAAINPLTMVRVNSNVQICDWPANLISNYNIKLADRETMPVDKAAPEIGMNMIVVPGQVIPGMGTAPKFVAGTIPAGTEIELPISIVDRDMGTATLTVAFTSPDGFSNQTTSVQLTRSGSEIQSTVSADVPVAISKYAYQPSFPETLAGNQAKYFKPSTAGIYDLMVEAADAAGNRSSKNLSVRAVPAGEMPGGIPGPPRVDEILPKDGAVNVSVSTTISIAFSEPVDTTTVTAASLQLIDPDNGGRIPAFIYTSLEEGRMKATLLPKNNLVYGKTYEIVVTQAVKDSISNPVPYDEFMSLDREYHARFTTKLPTVYDLSGGFALIPGGKGGTDIALYTHRATGRNYAYVAFEEAGWGVADVTDPVSPVMTHQVNYTQPPQSTSPHVSWRYRGVAVDQERGILAITEWITFHNAESSQGNYGYIGFYDLKTNPEKPTLIGRDRLAENFSGVPYHVALSGNYAYVATVMVGIQVVDVEKATAPHQAGDAIVGYYDSMGEGYGSPYDVSLLKGNLYCATSKGHLLILNTVVPQLPSLIGKVEPGDAFRALRVSVLGDYAYTDVAGQPRIIDLAMASNGAGNIYFVDVTDPTSPKVISSLSGISGTDISISRAGMSYITAGTVVDVVDIKDPDNPKLLNAVGNEYYDNGASVSLGYNRALLEQDGWLYLANQQEGLQTLDLETAEEPPPVKNECSLCEAECDRCKDSNQDQCQPTGSAVNMRMREYQRDATDLTVKVPGGVLSAQRWYNSNRWTWDHAKDNLIFRRGSDDKIEAIEKGGVVYGVASVTGDLFTSGVYRITKKADNTGWKWVDKSGNWKEFNASGRITAYGDRTGVTRRLLYEPGDNGRLTGVADRNNRQVITYEYNSDSQIAAATDLAGRRVEYTYTGGLLTKVKDVLGGETTHTYDTLGRITGSIDAAGRESKVSYDNFGRVASVLDGAGKGQYFRYYYNSGKREYYSRLETSAGYVKETWYDESGATARVNINGRTVKRIVKDGRNLTIIDEAGNATIKFYDASDNLTKVAYPDGTAVFYEYEPAFNRRSKETDEKGVITTYEYDGTGNLTRKTEAQGAATERVTSYTYDTNGNLLTTVTSADANTQATTTTMTYDASGNLASTTDPEGNVTSYTYDSMGNVLTKKDGRDKIWTYEYNAKGQLTKAIDPFSRATQFFYDGVGNKIREIDPAGKETGSTYNGNNKVTSVTDAYGNMTTFAYDADGRLTSQTDAEGKAISYQYDADGRLTKTIDGNGNQITNVYDDASGTCPSCSGAPSGKPAKTIFPTFSREFSYDNRGRKTAEKDVLSEAESVTTQYAYDERGSLKSRTDKESKITTYEYDELNRLKKVTDPLNGATLYTYDNRDNLIALTDAKNQTTTFVYNKNNRLTKETRPLGQETTYQYNPNNQLTRKTDAKGQRIDYTCDDAGRMTKIEYLSSWGFTTKTVDLTYDNAWNLTGYSDGNSSATYAYDDLYRKTGETVNYGGFSLTTSYSYNKNGTKKSFTYPNGTTVEYTYDSNNQPAGTTIPGVGTIAYNSYQWTRPTGITLPGGGKKQYTYDSLMRTKTITASDPAQNQQMSYSYTYDKMDNITAKNTEAGNYAYGYDDLYRLNDVKKDTNQTEAYTYDPVGNRLTSATATNWTYNQNNELQSYNGTTYQYDANGNTTQRNANGQIQNYVYDVDNRLIEVKDGSGGMIATYTYDPFGRKIKKDVGGAVTYYLYSNEGLIGEYDKTGAEIKIYGYKPDSTWTTDPVLMKEGANYYFYHNDHLGTPQKMTSISGVVVWSAIYDAFGKATIDAGVTAVSSLRFPGQYYDQEIGLHYNWHRFYDPGTGRYVSEDPLSLAGRNENIFKYVKNNPVNIIDPLGLYDYRVHFSDTINIATQAGLDWWQAYQLAKLDNDVDYKYDPWKNYQNRTDWHFISLQKVNDLLNYAYATGKIGDLAEALHGLQDYYGHTLNDKGPILGHMWTIDPDEPSTNWGLYFRMRNHTMIAIKHFLKMHPDYRQKCYSNNR